MDTISLNDSWDLQVNASGNIATATGPQAIAQDVASALRLFLGELYYDTTQGIPYFAQVLGQVYSPALVRSLLETAAKTVPGVVSAKATIISLVNRVLTGYVEIIDVTGEANKATFGV